MNLEQKIDLLILLIQQVLRFTVPDIRTGPLVADNQPHDPAPTKAETAFNPGKYYGTQFDPLNSVISHTSSVVIERFQTRPGFVGGKVTDWFRFDAAAMMAWFANQHGAPLNLANLHPMQKIAMGLPV